MAAGAFAPAALADDETTGETPTPEVDQGSGDAPLVALNDAPVAGVGDVAAARPGASLEGFFGRGKTVGFQVSYDDHTAPKGLDLSGAVFTLTGPAGTYSCTTGADGSCAVSSNIDINGSMAGGDFSVTQTGHPVGLASATGVGAVHLCGWMDPGCSTDPFEPVVNDSLFRSPVVSSVEDSVTARPVAAAGYTLTGPGYVVRPGLGDTAAAYLGDGSPQTVRASSAADGSLTFPGWFLPGTGYVLTPDGAVDGYHPDTDTTGIEIAPSTGALPVSLTGGSSRRSLSLLRSTRSSLPPRRRRPRSAHPAPRPRPAGTPARVGWLRRRRRRLWSPPPSSRPSPSSRPPRPCPRRPGRSTRPTGRTHRCRRPQARRRPH